MIDLEEAVKRASIDWVSTDALTAIKDACPFLSGELYDSIRFVPSSEGGKIVYGAPHAKYVLHGRSAIKLSQFKRYNPKAGWGEVPIDSVHVPLMVRRKEGSPDPWDPRVGIKWITLTEDGTSVIKEQKPNNFPLQGVKRAYTTYQNTIMEALPKPGETFTLRGITFRV